MQQEELQSAANVGQFHGVGAQEVFPHESMSSQPTPSSRCFESSCCAMSLRAASFFVFNFSDPVSYSRPVTGMTEMTSDIEAVTLQSPVDANRRHMHRPLTSSSVSSDVMNKSLVHHLFAFRRCLLNPRVFR